MLAVEAIDILQAVFYRERRAYLVGRLRGGHRRHPLVIALVHADDGVRVDALLTARARRYRSCSVTRAAIFTPTSTTSVRW